MTPMMKVRVTTALFDTKITCVHYMEFYDRLICVTLIFIPGKDEEARDEYVPISEYGDNIVQFLGKIRR